MCERSGLVENTRHDSRKPSGVRTAVSWDASPDTGISPVLVVAIAQALSPKSLVARTR